MKDLRISAIQKKSHARVLAVVAQATNDGGATVRQIQGLLLSQFDKMADEQTIVDIVEAMKHGGLVQVEHGSNHWMCTHAGLLEFESIKTCFTEALEKSTSPDVPMYA